jgi:hypothetical protein
VRKIAKDNYLIAYRGLSEEALFREKERANNLGLQATRMLVTPDRQLATRLASFTDEGLPRINPVLVKVQLSFDDVIPIMWENIPSYVVKGGFISNPKILEIERLK